LVLAAMVLDLQVWEQTAVTLYFLQYLQRVVVPEDKTTQIPLLAELLGDLVVVVHLHQVLLIKLLVRQVKVMLAEGGQVQTR
jgi:hypothetical protein